MAGELFRRTELNFGGAMSADQGLLVPNKGFTGILMQNMSLSYSQNVSRIYEIGKAGQVGNVYYIGGRSQGTLGAAHVVGPRLTMQTFYDNFSDVCQAATNDIQLLISSPVCPGQGGIRISYTAKYCVLVQVGMSVAAQDFVINDNSQLMFSNLQYSEQISGTPTTKGVGTVPGGVLPGIGGVGAGARLPGAGDAGGGAFGSGDAGGGDFITTLPIPALTGGPAGTGRFAGQ